jgi:methylated-DNA-protein-cysteine methyltransferase-like protein
MQYTLAIMRAVSSNTLTPDPELLQRLAPRIYEVVCQVPPGQVTTYGDVAAIVDEGCDARLVGAAMAQVKDPAVPWQRVVNAKGAISTRAASGMHSQRQRLEAEGVVFDERERIDLARFGWRGPDPAWAQQHGYQPLPARDSPTQPGLL